MPSVKVDLADHSYQVEITAHSLSAPKETSAFLSSKQFAIISNQLVADLYLEDLLKSLPSDSEVITILVPDTEQSKSFEQFIRLHTKLLEARFSRSSSIIALGGGVVGDLAGFVAATLHRGCNFIQVPTTLLAQVDSSVGGKTAINHATGKNLIGSFYQPNIVIIDPSTLSTLDDRQYAAGMAEVIKYGFIEDEHFLAWLDKNKEHIRNKDDRTLELMIARCCSIKAAVVSADEKEKGIRVLLNLGHTFAHAIENISGYGIWLHGEAVAVGMLLAAKLSVEHQWMKAEHYFKLEQLIKYFNLPLKLTAKINVDEVIDAMYLDKKNLNKDLQLVLPIKPGLSEVKSWTDENYLHKLITGFIPEK